MCAFKEKGDVLTWLQIYSMNSWQHFCSLISSSNKTNMLFSTPQNNLALKCWYVIIHGASYFVYLESLHVYIPNAIRLVNPSCYPNSTQRSYVSRRIIMDLLKEYRMVQLYSVITECKVYYCKHYSKWRNVGWGCMITDEIMVQYILFSTLREVCKNSSLKILVLIQIIIQLLVVTDLLSETMRKNHGTISQSISQSESKSTPSELSWLLASSKLVKFEEPSSVLYADLSVIINPLVLQPDNGMYLSFSYTSISLSTELSIVVARVVLFLVSSDHSDFPNCTTTTSFHLNTGDRWWMENLKCVRSLGSLLGHIFRRFKVSETPVSVLE